MNRKNDEAYYSILVGGIMRSNKEGLLYNFYFRWVVVVGIIMAGILGNYWAEVGAALTVIVILWAIYKIKGKWFYPIEGLCEILSVNTDKNGNKIYGSYLHIAPSNTLQIVPIYIRSKNIKIIDGLTINFGVKKSCFNRLGDILVNRYRTKRLRRLPSPYWWQDFRTPILEINTYQPQITQLMGVHLIDSKSLLHPVSISQAVINNDECYIKFNEPLVIPVGHPRGETIQINLELKIVNAWKGVIRFSGNVNNINQHVIRKVNVSHKYEVI